ncbi:MAG: tRNA (guanosine(37)-N1)-methyltransferase TrmD [Chloroflexi bacterium]|nr:tRNA (guanosine(37)-N1)-methyltransferase TrmD [Chloroflexota bacterium]
MRIDVVTLFPGMFAGPLAAGVLGRGLARGLLDVRLHDLRQFTTDRHRVVDDYPYGGGAGMVLKPEPLFAAVEQISAEVGRSPGDLAVLLLSPQGAPFTQATARELAGLSGMALLCGRYEGVDERVREHLVTREVSVGDYVLTGGELAALVIIDAVARCLPGVLGSSESVAEESFAAGVLEYPHYTRPATFRGWEVPEVLLSGDHGLVARWRREQSLLRTLVRRPELLAQATLTPSDRAFLVAHGWRGALE